MPRGWSRPIFHADKRAGFVASASEPVRADIEDDQQFLFWSVAARLCLGNDFLEPDLVLEGQNGLDQVVLRREVPVESRLRNPGGLDQLVNADIPDTAPGEQFARGTEYTALPTRPGRWVESELPDRVELIPGLKFWAASRVEAL